MRVVVADGPDAFRAARAELVRRVHVAGYDVAEARRAAIESGDGPYVWIGARMFQWECPGCGHVLTGEIGTEPVSGWTRPRWVVTGDATAPTLDPSLGCPLWRNGRCIGHYYLRAGELELVA